MGPFYFYMVKESISMMGTKMREYRALGVGDVNKGMPTGTTANGAADHLWGSNRVKAMFLCSRGEGAGALSRILPLLRGHSGWVS